MPGACTRSQKSQTVRPAARALAIGDPCAAGWLTRANCVECCRCLEEAKNLYAQEVGVSECAKLAKRRAEILMKAESTDLMLDCYQEADVLYESENQQGCVACRVGLDSRSALPEHGATQGDPKLPQ